MASLARSTIVVVHEVAQDSEGFSPFELLFGRKPWRLLDLIKENWEEGTGRLLVLGARH